MALRSSKSIESPCSILLVRGHRKSRSLATDRVIIDTVVSKYAAHLPLYRQSAMLERESGLELGARLWVVRVMRVG
jgi:transposase